jgi:HEAT repeat protein
MKNLPSVLLFLALALPGTGAARAQAGDEPIIRGKPLHEWAAALKDPDPRVRAEAARTLARLGPKARPALTALKEAFKDPDADVRAQAGYALAAMGPENLPLLLDALASGDPRGMLRTALRQFGPAVVPGLLKALAADEPRLRRAAAAALGEYPLSARTIVPALRRALSDPDVLVRVEAASALHTVNPFCTDAVPVLVKALKDTNADVRLRAVAALQDFDSDFEEAVAALRQALADEAGGVRVQAVLALCRIDPEQQGPRALPVLVAALGDKDPDVCAQAVSVVNQVAYQNKDELRAAGPALRTIVKNRKEYAPQAVTAALWALREQGLDARDAVPLLLDAARSGDPLVIEAALRDLPAIAPKDPAVFAALVEALRHKDGRVRIAAVNGIVQLGPGAKPAVPALVAAMRSSDDPHFRAQAAFGLGVLGPAAEVAAASLGDLLTDRHPDVQVGAAIALLRISPNQTKAALPALVRYLSRAEAVYIYSAQDVLKMLGPDAVAGLTEALKSKDLDLRRGAVRGLAMLGPAARPAVPALKQALKDEDLGVRVGAATDLAGLGVRDAELVAVLTESLTCRDQDLREQAVGTLATLEPVTKPAAPALLRIFKDPDEGNLRILAARALVGVGQEVEAVEPALVAALEDRNPEVRQAAVQAFVGVGSRDPAAIPALIAMLRDPTLHGPNASRQALLTFGDRAIPALLEAARDKDPDVRAAAFEVLPHVGPGGREDVRAAVKEALKDPDTRVRLTAAEDFLMVEHDSAKALGGALPVAEAGMKDTDPAVRFAAVQALGRAPRLQRGSIPEVQALLLTAAKDKNARVRQMAFQSLVRWAEPPPPADLLPVFLGAIKDRAVRDEALRFLPRYGSQARDAIPDLLAMMKGKNAGLRELAASVLVRIGNEDETVVAALLETFRNSKDVGMHVTIASLLPSLGPVRARPAIPELVAALTSDDPRLRIASVEALSLIDNENKRLLPALAEMLGKEDEQHGRSHVRQWVEAIMSRIGTPATQGLVELLKDKDPARRAGAAIALGALGKEAGKARPDLEEALKDDQVRVRVLAAEGVWLVSGEAAASVPVLGDAVKRAAVGVGTRRLAAEVLAAMGPRARDVVPALVEAARSQDELLAILAVQALGKIGPDAAAAVPALIDRLKEEGDSPVRHAAVVALADIGPGARGAVPQLVRLLKEAGPQERGMIVVTLGKIGTAADAGPALVEVMRTQSGSPEEGFFHPALIQALQRLGPQVCGDLAELLKDRRAAVRRNAVETLVSFGPQAKDVLPALLAALDDKDEEVALLVADAVWQIDRRKEGVPALARGLKAQSSDVRQRAANALNRMGPDAKAAVPDLLTAARDSNPLVRQAALNALRTIDPDAAAGVPPM